MTEKHRRVRVLSIDGGGMRGLYTSAYLSGLAKQAAARRSLDDIDVGKTFDLVVGTSTGGIIACALAAGVPLDDVSDLYSRYGKEIFPVKLPDRINVSLLRQCRSRSRHIAKGARALETVLKARFGNMTVRDVYDQRGIALAVPAVEMSRHHSWVFKTPHLGGHRDDNFRLVDVCLATSAAPLFRSMARVANPDMPGHYYVFVDGGLWANNPVLVGLIDALQMTEPGDRIEVFSLGSCPRPAGDILEPDDIDRGLPGWKFGGEAASISIDAQEFAYDNMANMLAKHVNRECRIVRFPRGNLPAEAMPYLDLDETSDRGLQVFVEQAQRDISLTLSACDQSHGEEGQLLATLLNDFVPREHGSDSGPT